jgi:hypothetical protein
MIYLIGAARLARAGLPEKHFWRAAVTSSQRGPRRPGQAGQPARRETILIRPHLASPPHLDCRLKLANKLYSTPCEETCRPLPTDLGHEAVRTLL